MSTRPAPQRRATPAATPKRGARRAKSAADATAAVRVAPAKPRQRMQPEDRERLIIQEAIRYFAEFGLNGGTLELARRMGITQPLLYKYFPTKEAMIERVFEELFPGHWDPRWEDLLDDETIPVAERLKRFYRDYAKLVLTYEHVRLFLWSGLGRFSYNTRYYNILTQRIFVRIARALRAEAAAAGARKPAKRIDELELERVQSLHAAVYHIAFRRWIHGQPMHCDIDALIDLKVDVFLDGVRASGAPSTAATRVKPANARRKG
jgi:AcrR family transcriptional regulator